jgi:hypothetical protein
MIYQDYGDLWVFGPRPFPVSIICSNTGLVTNLLPCTRKFHPQPGASLPAREGLGVIIVVIGVTDGRVPSSLATRVKHPISHRVPPANRR